MFRTEWIGTYGLWSMVYGLWSMVYGLWSMVYGLWSMDEFSDCSCARFAQRSPPKLIDQVGGAGFLTTRCRCVSAAGEVIPPNRRRVSEDEFAPNVLS